jgi:hypothetical protein
LNLFLFCLWGCTDGQAAPAKAQSSPAGFSEVQKEVFSDIARSVVGAYEALGRLDDRYDSQGDCSSNASDPDSEEDYCSIWRFTSSNPTLRVELTRFEPAGKRSSPMGYYQGWARFVDSATRRSRRISIRLSYTGDDVDVRLRVKPGSGKRAALSGF